MAFICILSILLIFCVGMALPAAGVRPSTRPVRASFSDASPLAIIIDSVDSYPNTWEHLSDADHDPLPSSRTYCYKHHARIGMADVQTHLMITANIRFDVDDFSFIEPQSPSFITSVTRMCFSCFVYIRLIRIIFFVFFIQHI